MRLFKIRSKPLLSLALAGALSVPAVAAAGHDVPFDSSSLDAAWGRHDGHDHERDRRDRFGRTVRLGEISADPRDGADFVDLERLFGTGHDPYAQLVLRAREAPVRLRAIRVELDDGRVVSRRLHRVLRPGEQLRVALPGRAGIDHLVVDYGDRDDRPTDRTPARLELYGVVDHGRDRDEWYGGRY